MTKKINPIAIIDHQGTDLVDKVAKVRVLLEDLNIDDKSDLIEDIELYIKSNFKRYYSEGIPMWLFLAYQLSWIEWVKDTKETLNNPNQGTP